MHCTSDVLATFSACSAAHINGHTDTQKEIAVLGRSTLFHPAKRFVQSIDWVSDLISKLNL
jgi:hypothetical protein